MTIGIATALRNERLQLIMDKFDAGSSGGEIRLYGGLRPSTAGLPTSLIGTCTMSKPSGTISNGVFTLDTITGDTAADSTGIITWARVVDSDGLFVMDIDAGETGDNAELLFNTTDVVVGGLINITSFSITEGGA